MSELSAEHPIKIAVTSGAFCSEVATAFRLQRSEEPQSPIRLFETGHAQLLEGLKSGAFDLGIATNGRCPDAFALFQMSRDQLAIAVPTHARSGDADGARKSVPGPVQTMYWTPLQDHEALEAALNALGRHDPGSAGAASLDVIAAITAAGYAIGIAPLRRIAAMSRWGVTAQPILGAPLHIDTVLLQIPRRTASNIERFVTRVRQISMLDDSDRPQYNE